MTGLFSKNTGIVFLPKSREEEYSVFDVVEGVECDHLEANYIYSTAQDWEEIEGDNNKFILEHAEKEYWLARSVSHLRLIIRGLDPALEKSVFEHLEEIIGPRVSADKVLNHLLIAPLKNPAAPHQAAKSALTNGFSVLALILDELEGLQPPLQRLTDLWLDIEDAEFNGFSESKEMVWMSVVEECDIAKLLKSPHSHDFIKHWNSLAYHFQAPLSRSSVGRLGKLLSAQLFPSEEAETAATTAQLQDEYAPAPHEENGHQAADYKTYKRVQKQISAIMEAVSGGRDRQANKFLKHLIKTQTDPHYATKSLCNIAQNCANIFRTDFEARCLKMACDLAPNDAWSLIQCGDHQKREGHYKLAIQFFTKAKQLGHAEVADSSIADVYSMAGKYSRSIDIYQRIPNYEDKPKVLTAIADNYRKMGYLDVAKKSYDKLIGQATNEEFCDQEARAIAGKAEIAKTQGDLPESETLYRMLLSRRDIENRDRLFYRLGLCNVLKLKEDFEGAFSVVDEIIQEYPFAMRARCTKSSILALFDREKEGLRSLPKINISDSFREWRILYYRGLLLLKLSRYTDAKKILVDQLLDAVAAKENDVMLRLGAALCLLSEHDIPQASMVLEKLPDLQDCHAQHLSLVLKLHLAIQQNDHELTTSLRTKITGLHITDQMLEKAVSALDNDDFSLALKFETNALLKLAA